MDSDKIKTEMAELSLLEQRKSASVASIRRAKDKLHAELVNMMETPRDVCDHAVLRYLERYMGIDVDAVRDEMRDLALDAIPARDGEHYWHPSGIVLIIGERGQIITVLSPEQAEKHEGRKLSNGERAARTETAQKQPIPSETNVNESATDGA